MSDRRGRGRQKKDHGQDPEPVAKLRRQSPAPRGARPHDPYAEIAIRAHVEPPNWRPRPAGPSPTPVIALLVSTVARDVPGEPLAFGVFALLAPQVESLLEPEPTDVLPDPEAIEIGAFHTDDASPEEIHALAGECRSHGLPQPTSREEFLQLLDLICWESRAAFVAFHVPTEVGRLAVASVRAAKDPGRGGFSHILWTRQGTGTRKHPTLANGEIEDFAHPRIVTRAIDGRRALVQFKPVKDRSYWKGVFPSIQPLAEALAGTSFDTLAEACEAFEVAPPPARDGSLAGAVEELRTEGRLYRVLLESHRELCPDQPPTAAISSGTYAQALLRQTGLTPPLERWPDFPRDVLAATAGAYFAGEVFVQARGTRLPVTTLDFGGAYALSAILAGAWEMLAAEGYEVLEEDPDEIGERIRSLADKIIVFEQGEGPPPDEEDWRFAAWTTVLMEAQGALLPHRPRRGETWTAKRAPLWSRKRSLPYQVADLLVHYVEGGQPVRIVRAFRLHPIGRRPLEVVRLPTGRVVDPNSENLVLALAEERARVEMDFSRTPAERKRIRGLLKGITNAMVSGLPIQVNDDEPTKLPRPQVVYDPRDGRAEEQSRHVIERPGAWYFPPIAAGVTATARLLLHIAIGTVRAMGGTVAYWDTDSVFVVANPLGGLMQFPGGIERSADGRPAIRVLSFAEIQAVRKLIEQLSPLPPELKPHFDVWEPNGGYWVRTREPRLLRLEPENELGLRGLPTELLLAPRAPKRYTVYRRERPGPHIELRDGKPVVVNPTAAAIQQLSRVEVVRPSEHGLPFLAPEGSPEWVAEGLEHLLRIDLGLPTKLPGWWDDPHISLVPASRPEIASLHPEARPFSRLAVTQIPLAGPVIAPWHEGFDPSSADWRDLFGRPVREQLPDGMWLAETMGHAFSRVWRSADSGSLDSDQMPAWFGTMGLLSPAPTIAIGVRRLGKESRHLGTGRETLTGPEYVDYGGDDSWRDLLRALRLLAHEPRAKAAIAEEVGITSRWLDGILAGQRPSPETEERLLAAAANRARQWIRDSQQPTLLPGTDKGVIAMYLDLAPPPVLICQECGASAGP
jgi:hypothetical protein